MLAFGPLWRGGNRPLPLLALECMALAALAWLAAKGALREAWLTLPRALRWGVAVLVAAPLAQLLPVPFSLWARLPGHEPYARALELVAGGDGWRAITVHAHATEFSWLAMLPGVAILLLVQQLAARQVRALLLVFCAAALFQAVVGIVQSGAAPASWIHFGNPPTGGTTTGTFVNRNHLAGLLAMALPILVAVWAVETLPGRHAHGALMREHPRHADQRMARRMVASLAVVLVLAALIFTRSRAGIACGLAAFGAAGLVLVWSGATPRVRVTLGVVALTALALAAYAGLTPVVDRFTAGQLALGYEGRARIVAATLRAGADFMPLGSGLGTFADVFPRYQAAGPVGYVEFAHNDYAQAFLELGAAGVAAMALIAFAYVARWRAIARGAGSRRLGIAQLAAGISLAALGVHGLFDFNLHIPANALAFAFLAGVFFYPSLGSTRDAGRG